MKLNYGSFLSVMETYYLDVQPYHAYFEIQTTGLSKGIRRQIMLLLSFTPEDRLDRLTELDKAVFSNLRNHRVNLSEELREYASGADPKKVKKHFSDSVIPGISSVGYLSLLTELENLVRSDASIVPAQKNSFLKDANACNEAVYDNDLKTDELLSGFLASVFLYAVLQDNRQLEGTIPEPVMAANYLINPRMARNQYFTGRMEELSSISENFALGRLSEPSDIQVISGPPGAGKSQLALEYAFLTVESGCSAIWIDAKDDQGFIDAYKALLVAVNLPADGDENAILRQAHTWATQHDCLIVLDDADYATREGQERINRFVPKLLPRKILITTRNPRPFFNYPIISLESFSEDDAVEFLHKRIGRNNLQEKQLLRLANRLDRLPLALEQAGAYLARYPNVRINTYFLQLDLKAEELLGDDTPLQSDAKNVLETVGLALDAMEDEDARFILTTLAYYPEAPYYLSPVEKKDLAFAAKYGNRLKSIILNALSDEKVFAKLSEKMTEFSLCEVEGTATFPSDESWMYKSSIFLTMHDLTKLAIRTVNTDALCAEDAILNWRGWIWDVYSHIEKAPNDTWRMRYFRDMLHIYVLSIIKLLWNTRKLWNAFTDEEAIEILNEARHILEEFYRVSVKFEDTFAEDIEAFVLEVLQRPKYDFDLPF